MIFRMKNKLVLISKRNLFLKQKNHLDDDRQELLQIALYNLMKEDSLGTFYKEVYANERKKRNKHKIK